MFYLGLFGTLINLVLFYTTAEPGNLLLAFVCFLGTSITHVTEPTKKEEE